MAKPTKKLFVTGVAGFIGSNFVAHILKHHPDYRIVGIDALTYAGNMDNLKPVADNPNFTFVHGTILDRSLLTQHMKGCDWVVHFAAESHVDRSITGPSEFIQTNIVGTQLLLDAAKELGISRFHHISTDEVFGELPLDQPDLKFNELTPYAPRSPYAASKASSDHLVRAYHQTYGLPVTISNCSNNYGPYQYPEKVIPLFICNALRDKPLTIYGQGLAIRDYLHVSDHCLAIDTILHQGKIGETYCIGGNAEKNGVEVASTILKLIKKPESLLTFVTDRPGHDMRYAIDYSKINRELGWSPSFSFEDGLAQTIEWYSNNQPYWQKITKTDYLDPTRKKQNKS